MRFSFYHIPALLAFIASGTLPAPILAQAPLSAEIRVNSQRELRTIPQTLFGSNIEWIWNGNLLWDSAADRLDPRYLNLVQGLGPSILRFPGGLFADHYDWRNGVGPRAQRPTTASMPGGAVSTHTFGTDEALELARQTGSRLLITVNAGTGTAEQAADWVRYVNLQSGGPRVDRWEIGNELYIPSSAPGLTGLASMTADAYAARVVEFATAMKAVDPAIKVGAIVDEYLGSTTSSTWTKTVLGRAGSVIDFVAVHCAYAPVVASTEQRDVRTVYGAMLAAPVLIRQSLDSLAARIDAEVPRRRGNIQIAVTEWGPFFHSDLGTVWFDHVKTLGSSLYTASAMMSFVKSSRTEVANHFKLTDPLYMGTIGTRGSQPAPTASYYALQIFTKHLGSRLIEHTTASPTYDTPAVGFVPAVSGVPYLDSVVTLSADGHACFVTVVNKNFDAAVDATIDLGSLIPATGNAIAWTLSGTGVDANTGTHLPGINGITWTRQIEALPNPRFYSGDSAEVQLQPATVRVESSRFVYRFPAASVTSIEIPVRDSAAAIEP